MTLLSLVALVSLCCRYVWEATHVIDDNSPLATITPDIVEKIRSGVEEGLLGGKITVIFSGIDVALMEQVTAKHVYDVGRDVLFNYKLAPIMVRPRVPLEKRIVNLSRIVKCLRHLSF